MGNYRMKVSDFSENAGGFLRELGMSPPHPDSFETINNISKTIREYRDYTKPFSSSWDEYIHDVFHILGFNTKTETERLISLNEMGGTKSRRAIVALLQQYENFDDIISGLKWTTFLFFALHYFRVDWGILTDGLCFRIFNRNRNCNKIYLHGNLEEIIRDEDFQDFFAFYNIISLIRGKPLQLKGKASSKRYKRSRGYDLDYHLANKSNTVITLLEVLRSRIKSLSNQIEERFNKYYVGYYDSKGFCQIRVQKYQLKIWINLDIHEIRDPLSMCRDVRRIGHYGMGHTELILRTFKEVDAAFDIIQQAYEKRNKYTRKSQINKRSQNRNKRKKFWTELLEKAKRLTSLHANVTPREGNWISAGAGKTGLSYSYVVRINDAEIQLYIDNGNQKWNNDTFDFFYRQKDEIEKRFGDDLDWQLLKEKRASRIRYLIYDYGLKDEHYWSELQDLMIDRMIRLEKIFHPLITQLT